MSPLTATVFKDVVGRVASGVVVVAGLAHDGPVGFTCQTFASLSLDPTLASFAAGNTGQSWPRVRDVNVVGVSVLSDGQADVARLFASSGTDKFAHADWSSAPGGSPWLDGALAHFEGRIVALATHGDHDVVVVAVDHAVARSGQPLLYYRGEYRRLA
jgi:flavin reductase (DIM6/NTAB) family NADH-FMN oxidoreductase RutF